MSSRRRALREESTHLGERRAAGPLDVAECTPVFLERLRQVVPDGADLEHQHADSVGDDVVELARDARTLLCDGDARGGLALALRLQRAFLRRFCLRRALAQRESGEPRDREQDRDEDELAGGVARIVGVDISALANKIARPSRA